MDADFCDFDRCYDIDDSLFNKLRNLWGYQSFFFIEMHLHTGKCFIIKTAHLKTFLCIF